jgi:hypothetical protein
VRFLVARTHVGPGLRPGHAEQRSDAPSPTSPQKPPPNKNGAAPALGPAPPDFSLYFQNTKSQGVNWTFSKLYISPRIKDLPRNPRPRGLDKISAKPPPEPGKRKKERFVLMWGQRPPAVQPSQARPISTPKPLSFRRPSAARQEESASRRLQHSMARSCPEPAQGAQAVGPTREINKPRRTERNRTDPQRIRDQGLEPLILQAQEKNG